MNEFDKIIGIDRIKVVHVNDSKMNKVHIRPTRKYWIWIYWFDALNNVVHHEAFKDIPKILETPYVGEDKKNKSHHIALKSKC